MDVLIVEDTIEYVQAVTAVVRSAGHIVRTASTIQDALLSLSSAPPDLVILDLSLPDGDGLDLCRRIRETSTAYVLMLTGRDDEVDKLVGFRLGADDYMTKPFSPRELAARIEALSRRPREASSASADRAVGPLVIRPKSREVLIAGQEIPLTRIEFDLLDAFSGSPNVVFTRDQLRTKVWGENWFGDGHVVDVHVANLRKKLLAAGADNVIQTRRGVGYRLADQ